MFPRQGIALAGDRCTVEFVVDGLVVVDKACFHHDLAAGGVLHGVGAGKPITVCILEPVFYQSFQGLGGAAFAPPRSADAVARLPDALGEVESRPFISLCRFSQQAVVEADGAEHLSGGLFHDGPLVVVLVGIEDRLSKSMEILFQIILQQKELKSLSLERTHWELCLRNPIFYMIGFK